MSETESTLIRKGECPCGSSSDAFAIYSDGHGFCFSGGCQKRFTSHELRGLGYEVPEGDEDEHVPQRPRESYQRDFPLRGKPAALAKRKLTEETTKKFAYHLGDFGGRTVQIANYYDRDGLRVVAQKVRMPNKEFVWLGKPKEAAGLYGMWLWKTGGKKVVITEGEIDALSVSQIQDNKWPVVSLSGGAGSAAKDIKKELEWLNTFDQVILMFDNDEAGAAAVEAAVLLFPPGKVAVAKLPLKDASEMLQEGRGTEVYHAIWNAREWRPDSIVNAMDLWDVFMAPEEPGFPYPWEALNELTLGIRRREITTLTAGSGIGKSTVCRELAHYLLRSGASVGYIALEESNRKTLRELVGIELNRRLLRAGQEGEEPIPEETLRAAFERIVGSGRFYLYDHFGSLNSDRLLNHIRYMAVGLGVEWVVLDHLSIVVSGDDTMTDERRGIDMAMTKLRSLVEETGIGLILVSHLKRPDGKGHEEGAATSLAQLRGSAAIAQLSDMVLGLERNQQDPENKHQIAIRVLKNRYVGETGLGALLGYDTTTGRLHEVQMFEDEEGNEHGTGHDYGGDY